MYEVNEWTETMKALHPGWFDIVVIAAVRDVGRHGGGGFVGIFIQNHAKQWEMYVFDWYKANRHSAYLSKIQPSDRTNRHKWLRLALVLASLKRRKCLETPNIQRWKEMMSRRMEFQPYLAGITPSTGNT